jgi:hypothetical protein
VIRTLRGRVFWRGTQSVSFGRRGGRRNVVSDGVPVFARVGRFRGVFHGRRMLHRRRIGWRVGREHRPERLLARFAEFPCGYGDAAASTLRRLRFLGEMKLELLCAVELKRLLHRGSSGRASRAGRARASALPPAVVKPWEIVCKPDMRVRPRRPDFVTRLTGLPKIGTREAPATQEPWSARANWVSSASFRSDTARNDIPAWLQLRTWNPRREYDSTGVDEPSSAGATKTLIACFWRR